MSGVEVKRQVMEALEAGGGIGVADDDAIAALSTCVVLTAEEARQITDHIEPHELVALLTPQEKPWA